jgi:hypothetical protein
VKGINQGIVFGVFLLGYEILVICMYGFLFGYNADHFRTAVDVGGMILTSVLTIITVGGTQSS